jgi:hypothetical protein
MEPTNTTKRRNILGWIFSGIIALMLAASALDKITGSEHALQIAASFGISGSAYALLGGIDQ